MEKSAVLPKFHTHKTKGDYLRTQRYLITAAGNRNILHARGAKAARKYEDRIANDPDFAKKVVDLANAD